MRRVSYCLPAGVNLQKVTRYRQRVRTMRGAKAKEIYSTWFVASSSGWRALQDALHQVPQVSGERPSERPSRPSRPSRLSSAGPGAVAGASRLSGAGPGAVAGAGRKVSDVVAALAVGRVGRAGEAAVVAEGAGGEAAAAEEAEEEETHRSLHPQTKVWVAQGHVQPVTPPTLLSRLRRLLSS